MNDRDVRTVAAKQFVAYWSQLESPRFRWKEQYLMIAMMVKELSDLSDSSVDAHALDVLYEFIHDVVQGRDWHPPGDDE